MKIKLGTTPDSWGIWFPDEPRQVHWSRFLDEAELAGYRWIELGPAGYLPLDDPRQLRQEVEQRGLGVTAGTIIENLVDPAHWPTIEEQALKLGPVLVTLDAPYLVLIESCYTDLFTGEQVADTTLTSGEWDRLLATTHKLADLVSARFGLKLVFHPHVETHIEYEDQIATFLEQTDPARVGLCFDVGHHAYRDGDPVAFMRRHASRIPYLHFKSVDMQMRKKVTDERVPLATAVAMGVFCEPDVGAVDFPAFRAVLEECGYEGWAMVEQDMFPVAPDLPLPIARRTREYLEKVELSDPGEREAAAH